jgi:hypothetical protein
VIRLSVIYHAMSLTVHITKMSDTSITVIYHAMSLTVHITKMSDTSISDFCNHCSLVFCVTIKGSLNISLHFVSSKPKAKIFSHLGDMDR